MVRHVFQSAVTLALGLTLAFAVAAQQIYRVTDEKDGVVFTDRPNTVGKDSAVEEVKLNPTNRSEAVETREPEKPTTAADKASSAPEPSVTISAPDNESTIAMGPGNFSVSATAEPALGVSEMLQLTVDGEPQGPPQRSGSWFIEGALRGPHDLVVERINGNGDVVARSDSVRVYVLRPSTLNR